MDDGSQEVAVVGGVSLGQPLGSRNKLLLELSPDRLRDIKARSSTALLSLELKGSAHGVEDGIFDIGSRVDQVEVLATSLADDARIGSVAALSNTLADSTEELAEYGSAASVVKSSKFLVSQNSLGNLLGVTRNELNNILGETGLEKNLVN